MRSARTCQCGAEPVWRKASGKGKMARVAERLECPACGNATKPDTARERVASEWNEAGWCGQAVTPQPYVPFGPEWEAEMMHHRKPELVALFKDVCLESEALRSTVRRLQARLNRSELEEVVTRLEQRGVLVRKTGKAVEA